MSRIAKERYMGGDQRHHQALEQQLLARYLEFTQAELDRRRHEAMAQGVAASSLHGGLAGHIPAWFLSTVTEVPQEQADSWHTAALMMAAQVERARDVMVTPDELNDLLAPKVVEWFGAELADKTPEQLDQFVSALFHATIVVNHRLEQDLTTETPQQQRQRRDENYGLLNCYVMFVNEMADCFPAEHLRMVPAQQKKFNLMQHVHDVQKRVSRRRYKISQRRSEFESLAVKMERSVRDKSGYEAEREAALRRDTRVL